MLPSNTHELHQRKVNCSVKIVTSELGADWKSIGYALKLELTQTVPPPLTKIVCGP